MERDELRSGDEGTLAAMSLMENGVVVQDGWKGGFGRGPGRRVGSARRGWGVRPVFVLDAVNPDRSMAADNARVFGWKTNVKASETENISTPFPFQKGGYILLGVVGQPCRGNGLRGGSNGWYRLLYPTGFIGRLFDQSRNHRTFEEDAIGYGALRCVPQFFQRSSYRDFDHCASPIGDAMDGAFH